MATVVEIIENPVSVTVSASNVAVDVADQIVIVELGTTGPQGPAGTVNAADLAYVYEQSTPSTSWTINHGLSFIPNITVVDSAGTVVEGSYDYPNANSVILSFSNAFSGKAYLS